MPLPRSKPLQALAAAFCLVALAMVAPPAGAREQPDLTHLSDADRALMEAVASGNAARAEAALKAGADPDARVRPEGRTALMLAADRGFVELIPVLLDAGADVNGRGGDGWSALMQAAYERHAEAAKALLQAGADVSLRENKYGNTALLIAARRGADRIVRALLAHGADPNVQDKADGNTPLINAASAPYGRAPSMARDLLSAGAKPNLAANDGFTPLMAAARKGEAGMMALLLEYDAGVDATDEQGWTALMTAAAYGRGDLVRLLIDAGADPARRNDEGNTALCMAIDAREGRAVAALLAETPGEKLGAPCRSGRPPIARAARIGALSLIERLLRAGADPDARAEDGSTALMWAANAGYLDVVRLLLKHGADPTLEADDGWSPRKAAEMAGHGDIAALLEEEAG